MHMKRLFITFTSIILTVAHAQSPSDSPSPLSVVVNVVPADQTTSSGGGGASSALVLAVSNASSKSILGYELSIQFTDPATGTSLGRHGRVVLEGLKDGIQTYLQAGQEDGKNKAIAVPLTASGGMAQWNITIDLVYFQDGTAWGVGKFPEAKNLRQKAAHVLALK
jgi:hypothetical protein